MLENPQHPQFLFFQCLGTDLRLIKVFLALLRSHMLLSSIDRFSFHTMILFRAGVSK